MGVKPRFEIKAWHKKTRQYRQIVSMDFDRDGNIDCISTVDIETGYDRWDGLVDEYDLHVNIILENGGEEDGRD